MSSGFVAVKEYVDRLFSGEIGRTESFAMVIPAGYKRWLLDCRLHNVPVRVMRPFPRGVRGLRKIRELS